MTDAPTDAPTGPRPQRRGRRIAMAAEELTDFLAGERTCRVATVSPSGPHATPLWFVWVEQALWLYSLTGSQRWADLQRDPRIGVVVDGGVEYFELRGAELTGTVEVVGPVPVSGPVPGLGAVERAFGEKYFGGAEMIHDGRHGWLRVTVDKIASWDFRKLG